MANFNATSGTDTQTQGNGSDSVTFTAANQIDATDFFDGGSGGGSDTIIVSGAAGLTIDFSVAGTDSTHGFHNYDDLSFNNSSGTSSATFNANQFGTGLISTSLRVTGAAGTQQIVINNASGFSAAGWTFGTWTSGTDTLTINGTSGGDTIAGSSQADTIIGAAGGDTITGGAGADSLTGGTGADSLTGGTGADTFVISAAADLAAGETINGTAEAGTLDTLRLNEAAAYNLSTFSTLSNLDRITLGQNASGFALTVSDSQVSSADANGDGSGGDMLIDSTVS